MLLANTKKFFRRTFHSFKSLFSTEYQRLPKTHNSPLIIQTHQWDSPKDPKNDEERRKIQQQNDHHHHHHHHHQSPIQNKNKNKMKMKQTEKKDNIKGRRNRNSGSGWDSGVRNSMIEKKLRELEKLDMGNVEYVLDIEEVLHYYSRLTCPAYIEIVDNFFMQMYSDLFSPISKLPLQNQ